MLRQLRGQRGLTLVELMVVVGISAVVAITAFQDIQKKAKLAADNGRVAAIRSAVAIYYGKNNGLFPPAIGTVYPLVTPAINDASFHCATPTCFSGNGKVEYTASHADLPMSFGRPSGRWTRRYGVQGVV
jgi:prepilin-type N-terminal cleavage/methylation domain-containing protein